MTPPPPTRQKRNVPAAMDKVVGLFMKESNQYWKVIETNLRAAGHNPTLCLEAARAHKQGMHHDVELARAYNSALSDAKSVAMTEKSEKRKNRHARSG